MSTVLDALWLGEDAHPFWLQLAAYTRSALDRVDAATSGLTRWQLMLASVLVTFILCRLCLFVAELDRGLVDWAKKIVFRLAKRLPLLNTRITQELDKTKRGLEDDIQKANGGRKFVQCLPPLGLTDEQVLTKVSADYVAISDTKSWQSGGVSGCVYGADARLTQLTTRVYEQFAWTNPMHADVFPDVRKMEAEVVRMVLNLFHGDQNACGTMTSGGTESIMLACKAYRDMAYERGVKRPEMVIPQTAHAAFDKAGHFFRIRVHHVPVDARTKRVDARRMARYINANTCLLVGSAPQFPHGAIDPIAELSALAVRHGVPLHVDACLGGFLVGFMRDAGFSLPAFDFALAGVTSISCDTHKYGYTPKGSSVIMYRSAAYRKYQYFAAVEWPGGIYVSPTFAGSRAGSLIAMTWATLMAIGHKGYVDATRDIINTTRTITDAIRKVKELELMCEPDVSVVSFTSQDFNILRMLDEMAAKGWHLNAIQNPPGIHIAVTKMHTQPGVVDRLISDIRQSTKDIMSRDDRKLGKMAAIYCSTQSIPDKSLVADVACLYLDACYSTKDAIASDASTTTTPAGAVSTKTPKKK